MGYQEDDCIAAGIGALRRAKAAGVDSILDLGPLDLGRQPSMFLRVAAADTGVPRPARRRAGLLAPLTIAVLIIGSTNVPTCICPTSIAPNCDPSYPCESIHAPA